VDAIGTRDLETLGLAIADLDADPLVVTNANNSKLQSRGQIKLTVRIPNSGEQHESTLHVYDGLSSPLLSLNSLKALDLLPKEWPHQCSRVASTMTRGPYSETPTEEDISQVKAQLLEEFADVFDSASPTTFPAMHGEPMEIRLQSGATPFAMYNARTIPHKHKEKVKTQLDEMVQKGIIEPVAEASEWCHPLVVVSKKDSDEVRLTVDLTKLNQQVERPVHPARTPKEAISDIESAKFFTTLDARHGYWQVPLAEASRHLTTFITPWGRYRYLRNPQGFIAAGDEFNRRTDAVFAGIPQFSKVVDDCLTYDAGFSSHVQRVRTVLTQARKHGITFSEKKFNFAQAEVQYCGYLVGRDGWKVHPDKTKAIQEFPTPTNRTDLRSFMGLVNQFTEFTSRRQTSSSGSQNTTQRWIA